MSDLTRYRMVHAEDWNWDDDDGKWVDGTEACLSRLHIYTPDSTLQDIADAWKEHRTLQDKATRTGTTTGTPWTTFQKVAALLDALKQ